MTWNEWERKNKMMEFGKKKTGKIMGGSVKDDEMEGKNSRKVAKKGKMSSAKYNHYS